MSSRNAFSFLAGGPTTTNQSAASKKRSRRRRKKKKKKEGEGAQQQQQGQAQNNRRPTQDQFQSIKNFLGSVGNWSDAEIRAAYSRVQQSGGPVNSASVHRAITQKSRSSAGSRSANGSNGTLSPDERLAQMRMSNMRGLPRATSGSAGLLEQKAQRFNPANSDLLQRWCRSLKSSQHFRKTFLDSKALQIAVRQSMYFFQKKSHQTSHARVEKDLLELFSLTLPGSREDHVWLLNYLKRADLPQGTETDTFFFQQLQKALAAQMRAYTSLKVIDVVMALPPIEKKHWPLPLDPKLQRLAQAKGDISDVIKRKAERDADADVLAKRLESFVHVWGVDAPRHDLQLTFWQVESAVREFQKQTSKHVSENLQLLESSRERTTTVENQKRANLEQLKSTTTRIESKRAALQKIKEEYEKKLREVQHELDLINKEAHAHARKVADVEADFSSRFSATSHVEKNLEEAYRISQADTKSMEFMLGMTLAVYNRSDSITRARSAGMLEQGTRLFDQYLDAIRDKVLSNHRLIQKLQLREKFCEKKLRSTKLERKELQDMGLDDSATSQLEQQLQQSLRDDKSLIASIIQDVAASLEKIESLTPPYACDQALTKLRALLKNIQPCSSVFDFTVVKNLEQQIVKHVNASARKRAQRKNPSQSVSKTTVQTGLEKKATASAPAASARAPAAPTSETPSTSSPLSASSPSTSSSTSSKPTPQARVKTKTLPHRPVANAWGAAKSTPAVSLDSLHVEAPVATKTEAKDTGRRHGRGNRWSN